MEDGKLQKLKSRLKEEFSGYYELSGGKNYRYYHLERVHKYALKLMEKPEIRELEFDREVVEIAVLFHDIGRAEDIEDDYLDPIEEHEGHAEKGAETVSEYIEDLVTEDRLGKIEKVIRNHHSEPETIEGKIVQDADLLDKYGVHNLWRKIHYSADKQETLDEALEYFWNGMVKQNNQKMNDFHFQITKRIARKRTAHFQQVMTVFEDQLEGEDI